jgi:hypothetical protein
VFRFGLAAALAWFALCDAPAQGDILYLTDGSRYSGSLVRETEDEIIFRVTSADGRSSAVRRFPRKRVDRVESSAFMPGTAQPRVAAPSAADFEQMLREAFELIDDDDHAAALRALQRVAQEAPPELLERLDGQTRAQRGRPLAELLAQLRVEAALRTPTGRGFRIRHATAYEAEALAGRLAAMEAELLARVHGGRTLESWSWTPEEWTDVGPAARTLVVDAERGAGVVGARLRFDPRVRRDSQLRPALVEMRDRLARLAARVAGLRGFTSLDAADDPADPTLGEARRLEVAQSAAPENAESQPDAGTSAPASRPASGNLP